MNYSIYLAACIAISNLTVPHVFCENTHTDGQSQSLDGLAKAGKLAISRRVEGQPNKFKRVVEVLGSGCLIAFKTQKFAKGGFRANILDLKHGSMEAWCLLMLKSQLLR